MLPWWVQAVQALAVPVIAVVGTWVAIQQMVIARAKLQHDLYERRYAVFDAVRTYLAEVMSNGIASQETTRTFVLKTGDAEFLFDDELAAYLKEMREHASTARAIHFVIEPLQPGDRKAAAFSKESEHTMWLVNQMDGLVGRFRPFLRLEKRKRRA